MSALFILIPLILMAALGAVWKARPVHAALLLAAALALVGVVFLMLGAHFIGLVQFMVYVGAVAVLIVFSLLITRQRDELEEIARRPLVVFAGLGCSLPVLGVMLVTVSKVEPRAANDSAAIDLAALGKILYTTHAPAVLGIGVLLTAVMIGAALFAREAKGKSTSNDL